MEREDHRMRDYFAFLKPQAVHDSGDPVAAEKPHQIVFQREEELAAARVALAPGASAELKVDTARLMALRADNRQSSQSRPRPRRA